MSQSPLVMAGLDYTSATALAGGLLVWLSAGLAFAGLARCVLVLEARRGRLDLTTYHGGYERMPVLAIGGLAMGLACTGFPGTLGFIGALIGLGVAPRPLVDSRFAASADILRQRQVRMLGVDVSKGTN